MNLKALFSKIPQFFRFVFSVAGLKRIDTALKQVEDLVPDALSVVKTIAVLTPNRTDDEIIELAESYAFGPVTPDMLTRKEDVLRALARLMLKRNTRLDLKDHIANTAIEFANTIFKNGK